MTAYHPQAEDEGVDNDRLWCVWTVAPPTHTRSPMPLESRACMEAWLPKLGPTAWLLWVRLVEVAGAGTTWRGLADWLGVKPSKARAAMRRLWRYGRVSYRSGDTSGTVYVLTGGHDPR